MAGLSARPRSVRLRWALVVALAVISATSAFGAAIAPAASSASPSASVSSESASAPTAFPPIHTEILGLSSADTVNPTGYYDREPAPMGIGDFGVGADDQPYTYNTTEFLGNFSWQHLNLNGGSGTSFTDQLNVVLQFVRDGTTYAYWIQDVAFMDSSDNDLGFENNIWNFSSSSACLDNSGVQGNGTVYEYSGCEGYYAVSPASSLPGASLLMPNPGDFGLLVRSYVTSAGLPAVAFEYWDGVTSWYVTYDNVVFPWAKGFSSDNGFVVDGSEYNPLGLYYDAELTIGGPGGGSNTSAQATTDASSRLLYWNGHNFEAPPSVWNFGSNTAEAVENLQSYFGHDASGWPYTIQLNGTARNATPAQAYNQNEVGTLQVSDSASSSGTLAVLHDDYPFVDGLAQVTVVGGTYPIWVNASGSHTALGTCTVTPGATTYATVTAGCAPWVGTPTASPASIDLGQSVTFNTTVLDSGSGGDTFVWSTSPSGLGCTASTSETLACTPTATGTYHVQVTMTDSEDASNESGILSFVVDSDPTVATPTASPTSVETGESVTFTASPSGGATPYSYTWHDLPGTCSGTTGATPTCRPTSAGEFSVSVTVKDANGESTTSSTLDFTATPGPSVATPTAAPSASRDLGQSLTLSAVASGGTGALSYSWKDLPTGCASADSASLNCTPTASGTFAVSVDVTDADDATADSSALSVVIEPAVAVTGVTLSRASADVGQAWSATASGVTGGSGVYTYSWSGLPAGCASANASVVSCAPSAAASGTVSVVVVDSNGGNDSARASYVVDSDPSLTGLVASRPGADLGQSVNFSAEGLAGGSGGFSYSWSGLPSGCATADAATVECTPDAIGSSSVLVTVTDSNGVSANASLSFTTYPVLSAAPSASVTALAAGSTVTFSAGAVGGDGPYAYVWSGLPTGCASRDTASLACTPSAAGSFDAVTVTVTDANGAVAVGHAPAVTVSPAPASSGSGSFLGLPADEGYLVLGVLVAAIAVGLGAVLVRRRKTA